MMEASKVTLPVLDFNAEGIENYENLKSELIVTIQKYKNLIVTDENYKDCKVIRKDLTKMKKTIDDFRKEKKKEMLAPINEFEDKCKTLCRLIEDVEKPIKEATDRYDDEVREQKKTYARCAIEVAINEYGLNGYFANQLILKDEYSNLSASKTKVKEDIEQKAQWLAIEQEKYEKRYEVVLAAIEKENETLTNGLLISDYNDLILESTDSSAVLKKVTEAALKKREEERRVREEFDKEFEDFEPIEDDMAEIFDDDFKETIEELPTDNVIIATLECSGSERKMNALIAFCKATGIDCEIKEWGSF